MKDFLDSVGPGFCLAKWTQATIHLGVGLTHSCHHTKAHHIDVEAIKKDPSALHNTEQKQNDRAAMLNGHRLPDCNYCWRVEDANAGVSDRVVKSSAPWSTVDKDHILNNNWQRYPRSLEVSFSNVCNFACAYCGPTYSSQWAEEINTHGAYQLPGSKAYNNLAVSQIPNKEDNPYIYAFWKWFPDIVDGLHEFRITGGEPLLSKHTFKILETVSQGKYNLDLGINTNACPPDKVWQRFIDHCAQIENNSSVKNLTVYASAETVGEDAEYIRDGMIWDKFVANIEQLLDSTDTVNVSFMSTVSVLSVFRMKQFLELLVHWKDKYGDHRVRADLAQLKHPTFLDVSNFITPSTINLLLSNINYLEDKPNMKREFGRLNTIKNVMVNNAGNPQQKHKDQLRIFLETYDQRRSKDHRTIFTDLDI